MSIRSEKLHQDQLPFKKTLFSFSSVRVKLMLWYVAVMTLVLLVFGGLLYITLARTLPSVNAYGLANTVQQLATTYHAADGTLHVQRAGSNSYIFGKGDELGEIDVAVVINMQGEVVQTLGQVSEDALAPVKRFIAANNNESFACDTLGLPVGTTDGEVVSREYDVCMTALLSHNQRVGSLVVARPSDNQRALQDLVKQLLLAGPAIVLILAAGGYWLAARAMRPVQLITRTAQKIGQTDLSRRLRLTSRDELGELAATFDGMLDRLEAAFERQRQFTADASHELRTPLTIMDVAVSQALSQSRIPEDYEQALGIIEANKQALTVIGAENEHMSQLVNDLLTLARVDTGQDVLGKEAIDVSEVILDVVERLVPLAHERGIGLSLGELPELLVAGDRMSLTSMITNLIDNALKYPSRIDPRVHVESGRGQAEQEQWCWIRVEDNGPGIAVEHVPHLFGRFYRVDAVRTFVQAQTGDASAAAQPVESSSGSGLGLSIVQWVAQAHGGEVRVQSEEGLGTAFEVWLPLLEHSEQQTDSRPG